jgi:hypothetical protein
LIFLIYAYGIGPDTSMGMCEAKAPKGIFQIPLDAEVFPVAAHKASVLVAPCIGKRFVFWYRVKVKHLKVAEQG